MEQKTPRSHAKWESEQEYHLNFLTFEHFHEVPPKNLWSILQEYPRFHDGTLREVVETEHPINQKSWAKPHRQLPNRTGHGSQEVIKEHVEKIHKLGLIEPATKTWKTLVVIAPNTDAVYWLFVYHHLLNPITVQDSYLLPHINENDCLRYWR